MPTYEFGCPAGHTFDRFFRKISDGVSELPCPECGAMATRRVSGGAGLLFKGSGFYITDYGKDGKKDAPSAEKKEKARASGEPKSDAGGEAPAAPKPDVKTVDTKSSGPKSSGGGGTGGGTAE